MRVTHGTLLTEATGRAGMVLRMPCGGAGTCGKCRVRIAEGAADADPSAGALDAEELDAGWRLACRTPVTSDIVVEVPEESLFESTQRILTDDADDHSTHLAPAARCVPFEIPPPSSTDTRSDQRRLSDALGPDITLPPHVVKQLPALLRDNNWQGHALLYNDQASSVCANDLPTLGVAFDLGTTTVVGTLIDLKSGKSLDVASCLNAQITEGDDVLSRVLKVRERPEMLATLRDAAISTLNTIIAELCKESGVTSDQIHDITLAGNTTMQQLVCGIDPSALGEVPFIPAFEAPQLLSATEMGLTTNPHARAFIFPQVGGFVGGDTVSAMLASDLDRRTDTVLLIDIGTNGEIVLAANGRLLCTSAAAGPAFEGAHIQQGMRAATGAIDRVEFNTDLHVSVIGDGPATGLCGTALIDVVAGMLTNDLLETTGRILEPSESSAPPPLRDRLQGSENTARLQLADGNGTSDPVCLWQRDIRELQLASGAIHAGVHALMQMAGITEDDIDAVLLAGAFGNYIRRENAIRIGMLPAIPLERVHFIGNAASLGAKLALTSRHARARATALGDRAEHVDLSTDANFQMAFGMAMMFPEG